jgi:hypothetical protein
VAKYTVSVEYDAAPATTVTLPSNAGEAATDDEFDRFEDLTSKLIQVPKTELDEQRNESASSS